jgi:ABC-2 type transport system permease protein
MRIEDCAMNHSPASNHGGRTDDARSSILYPLSSSVLPIASLWWREVVRFYRQPSRVIGGLGSPLLFWVLIGSGIGGSFRHAVDGTEMNYLEYFFPGTLTMILLFTAIFSTVSVIEDRREGFLQSVLVAPVSRTSIVLGKVLGGATLAAVQGLLFLLLAPAAGVRPTLLGLACSIVMILLVAVAMTCLGFLVAWPMESTQGFHSVMNLFLIPLWLLSGALFPADGAAPALRWAIRLNPVSYGLEGIRQPLYWPSPPDSSALRSWAICAIVTCAFGLFTLAVSVAVARRPKTS